MISDAQLTDAGRYTVIISNGLGGLTTAPAEREVRPAETSMAPYAGVTMNGLIGKTYRIDYATALRPNDWAPESTNTLAAPRVLRYDSQPASQPKRFYRVVVAP